MGCYNGWVLHVALRAVSLVLLAPILYTFMEAAYMSRTDALITVIVIIVAVLVLCDMFKHPGER